MMEKVQHSSHSYFVQIRMTLILIAIVSFPFNLIGIFTENAQAESINQIVALSSSGLSAIVWLYWYRGNAALSKATAGAIINDLFFAIYLAVVYLTMIIISEGVREHVIFVYGNLACLVSSLFHALAVLMAATYRYKAYLARVSQPKNITLCPRCSCMLNHFATDGEQEVGVAVLPMASGLIDIESEPLMGSDSATSARFPFFRTSEETAVSLGSVLTMETFDGPSRAVEK
ncbi:uncharacterized protein BDW43DRAFT_294577 [Aspergillus alliaceus]|nr:uncharacterized protein BDW43DRAFT_294577 [Aspergillus alliaceus]KAB8227241.1 hypothetical protein BDW43DRAFT_294577 [Aspergillus alliaceus]